jgi:RimJ/RimL family protein N-acetyltransferase
MESNQTAILRTTRLVLHPLTVGDAAEMVHVLADHALYDFTGGRPPSLEALEQTYERQIAGSPRSGEVWHNWVIRLRESELAIGFVQATARSDRADVAWLVGTKWQSRGFATEAAAEMCRWLREGGIDLFTAHVRRGHVASEHVAAAIGFHATDETDEDGETVWTSSRT